MISTADITNSSEAKEKLQELERAHKVNLTTAIAANEIAIRKVEAKKKLTHHDANILIGLNLMLKELYILLEEEELNFDISDNEMVYGDSSTWSIKEGWKSGSTKDWGGTWNEEEEN